MFDNYQVIDLTLTLDEQLPCSWPGHMPFQRKTWNWYVQSETAEGEERSNRMGPYYTEWLLADEHAGTHFDAPSHFIPQPESGIPGAAPAGAITGEKVELRKLMGKAVVIDLTELCGQGRNGESPYILPGHLQAWESKHGAIAKNDIVLLHTGWDRYYAAGEPGNNYAYNALVAKVGPGWPAPDVQAMEYLFEKGVRCVGTDGASMGSTHNGAPVHVFGLAREMVYVESLTNLGQLPPRGSYFIFLPLKVNGSSGCPGRAVALIPPA